MFSTKSFKVIAATAALIVIATASVSLVNQSASAQSNGKGLHPPFAFQKSIQHSAPDLGFPPLTGTLVFSETFGASFVPTTTLVTANPMWHSVINSGAGSDYYWGRVTSGSFANTAWTAASSITSTALTAGVDDYPANQDTWLIYGPLDLTHYGSAQLIFDYYLDTQADDWLSWGISTDGQNFFGSSLSGPISTGSNWYSGTLNLGFATTAQAPIYLAFAFNSNGSANGLGAFIRNLKVIGEPLKQVFVPLINKNFFGFPVFEYTFDDGGTQLAHWGGAFYSSGSIKFGQCIPGQCTMHATTAHGNPGNSLRLYTNGLFNMIASSPNDIVSSSFDLFVDISPWRYFPRSADCTFGCPNPDLGDWYGVIFNASSDTFGANPSQFAYNKKYYRVYFYNRDAANPIAINLDRCDGASDPGSNSCHTLGTGTLPSNFIGNAGAWDQLHIVRSTSDGKIQVYVNGSLRISAQDNTYKGASFGKYGIFMFSENQNATGVPDGHELQIDFDNIQIYK